MRQGIPLLAQTLRVGPLAYPTYAHSRHRLEVFDDALCHVLALPYFEEYGDVLEQMLSVEAADRQALDLITRSRYAAFPFCRVHLQTKS